MISELSFELKKKIDLALEEFDQDIEINNNFPDEIFRKLGEYGILGGPLPKEYGGLGLDDIEYGLLIEYITTFSCAIRTLLTVHTSLVGQTLLRFGTSKQKEKWLPMICSGEILAAFALNEPNSGSDAKSLKTSYTFDGEYYYLSGTKKWISFGDKCNLYLLAAINGQTISCFLVEKDESVISNEIDNSVVGKGTHIGLVEFQNTKVHKDNLILKEGLGFSHVVNTALDYGRYCVAWGGVGIACEALRKMVHYSRKTKRFGATLINNQLIRGMISDAFTDYSVSKSACLKAGNLRKNGDLDAVMETNIAKYFSSKMANDVCSTAMQIYGANGFLEENKISTLFMEAKVLEIIEGSSQIQQELIFQYGFERNRN